MCIELNGLRVYKDLEAINVRAWQERSRAGILELVVSCHFRLFRSNLCLMEFQKIYVDRPVMSVNEFI